MPIGNKPHIPELLAPAGNFEKLAVAVHYGADAVYLGGERFGLRANSDNFDENGIIEAVEFAHSKDVHVYITVNIFAHNQDLAGLDEYLLFLKNAGVDGVIIADPGIFHLTRQIVPDLPVHLSTQANVTNMASAAFWAARGVTRINLARELSLDEIRQIRESTGVALEVFVHGALCISYSGRCLLSQYLTGRDANRGNCAHPCRYSYQLVEEKRPGEYHPVVEDARGTYIFNSRDLCLLNRLPELLRAGVDALKIEGRMKSAGYVGGVVRVYRAALDQLAEQMSTGRDLDDCVVPDYLHKELAKIGVRGLTENFFSGPPDGDNMNHQGTRTRQQWAPAAIVRKVNPLLVEARNPLRIGDRIEFLGGKCRNIEVVVTKLKSENGDEIPRANPGSRIYLHTDPELPAAAVHSIFRIQSFRPKGDSSAV